MTAPYTPPVGAPTAVIVDIDGTVALLGGRHPDHETDVGKDLPNTPVITVVRALQTAGHHIVFCTGRTETCRKATEKWLADHLAIPVENLIMRPVDDHRQDTTMKLAMFDEHIRHRYHVVAVLEDRDRVVHAWRSIGLTVLQVDDGDY